MLRARIVVEAGERRVDAAPDLGDGGTHGRGFARALPGQVLAAGGELPRAHAIEARLGQPLRWERAAPLGGKPQGVPAPAMATLRIDAGRSDKLRPGDIVGALTGEAGLHKDAIGKIDVFATRSYVAVARKQAQGALEKLRAGKIKGRRLRVQLL